MISVNSFGSILNNEPFLSKKNVRLRGKYVVFSPRKVAKKGLAGGIKAIADLLKQG